MYILIFATILMSILVFFSMTVKSSPISRSIETKQSSHTPIPLSW